MWKDNDTKHICILKGGISIKKIHELIKHLDVFGFFMILDLI
jgi:hypothetical protein